MMINAHDGDSVRSDPGTAADLNARAQLLEVSTLVLHREPTHVLAACVNRDVVAVVARAIKAVHVVVREGRIRMRDLHSNPELHCGTVHQITK